MRREGRNCFLLGLVLSVGFGSIAVLAWETAQGYPPALVAGGLMGVFAVWLVWFTLSSLRHWVQPTSHPLYRELSSFGLAVTVFESQVAQADRIGAFVFLPEGLYDTSGVRFSAYRDVMWMYKKTVNYGQHLVVCRRDGARHGFNGSAIRVQGVLAILALKCPWAVTGFSGELENRWIKQRAQFIAEVDAARQPVEALMHQPV